MDGRREGRKSELTGNNEEKTNARQNWGLHLLPKGYNLLLPELLHLLSKCWLSCSPRACVSGSNFSPTWVNNFTESLLNQFPRLTLTVRIVLYISFPFLFLSSPHHSCLYLPREHFNVHFSSYIYLLEVTAKCTGLNLTHQSAIINKWVRLSLLQDA